MNTYLTLATCTLVSLLCLLGCGGQHAAQKGASKTTEAGPVVVTVAPVTLRPLQRRVEIVGNFSGYEEFAIGAKVDGRVRRICHEVGDIVAPGECLFEIDDTDYLLAVTEAEQAVAAELAKIGLDMLPEGELDVKKLPTVERARVMLANSETKLGRSNALFTRGAETKEQRDQAEADYNVSKADYRQMELDARATLATARHKASLLATARQKLKDTIVAVPAPSPKLGQGKTPPPYVVAERMVSEGEMIHSRPATQVFKLVINNPLKLKANVPERHGADVKVGQPVEIRVEAFPDKIFSGVVSRINPTVNRASRTFQVEVVVENAALELKAGNFAKAAIISRAEDMARTIPAECLVSFAGVNKVFTIHDDKAQAVEVQLGVRGEGWLEVTSALPPDTLVVTSGMVKLTDGAPVRVRSSETPANHSAPEGLSQR